MNKKAYLQSNINHIQSLQKRVHDEPPAVEWAGFKICRENLCLLFSVLLLGNFHCRYIYFPVNGRI